MKYKVGDRVRVQSLDWYNENKNKSGNVPMGQFSFNFCNKHLCGTILTIRRVLGDYYLVKENDAYWTDEMIEGLVEEEAKSKPKFKVGDSVEVLKSGNTYTISQVKFNGKEFVYTLSNNGSTLSCFSENELKPIHFIDIAIKPHNVRGDEIIKMLEELGGTNVFSFDGSDHNCVNPFAYYIDKDKQIYGGGIEFLRRNGYKIHTLEELKKKEYPKTYEECLSVLGIYNGLPDVEIYNAKPSECELFEAFIRLKRCRDAYWKIAGEEMELGKDLPWVPDWMCIDPIYVILYQYHAIYKAEVNGGTSCILAFPTEEIRDAFYENFKELIESCKELL